MIRRGGSASRQYVHPADRWPDVSIESMAAVKLRARNGDRRFLEDQVFARVVYIRKQKGGPGERIRYRSEIKQIKELIDEKRQ